jgi:large-conductance mechanosensitive channel
VIILVYFQLFTNPFVIVAIFVLYVVVSLRNRRKFNRQKEEAEAQRSKKAKSTR